MEGTDSGIMVIRAARIYSRGRVDEQGARTGEGGWYVVLRTTIKLYSCEHLADVVTKTYVLIQACCGNSVA